MPENGGNFDELLSAFLDGELSDEEFKHVQTELGRSEPLRRQLSELSDLSRELQQFYRNSSKADKARSGDRTLAARVIAEAQREAVQAGLPDDHHVRLAERAAIASISQDKVIDWKSLARIGSWAVAVAAAILLIVFGPRFFRETSVPDNLASVSGDEGLSTDEVAEPRRAQYVSEIDFRGDFVFVVDVELSPEARQNHSLELLLQRAGIKSSEPIVGGFEIKEALNSSRSIIDPARDADSSDAKVYFIRADFDSVAQVVEIIFADDKSFPQVAFDLAIDNPVSRLMETIARNTGERYTVDDAFVAPLAGDAVYPESSVASPFGRLPKSAGFVSTEMRKKGFDADALALLENDDLTSVLLIVR